VAVVGGLAFSQLITLFVTPVVYTYMDALRDRTGRWIGRFGKKGGQDVVPVAGSGAGARIAATSSGDAAD
jgi:HAE1 family hydrophobic/amphiphilic exporter-1